MHDLHTSKVFFPRVSTNLRWFFILPSDEEMIKQVLIKDFDFMVDRREFKMNNEYLDTMMTQLEGEQWRTMRNLMTPVFTSGKLKAMVPIMNKVCIGQKFCFQSILSFTYK